MDRDKRHRRVVRQRALAIIFTILVLGAIVFGAAAGITYLRENVSTFRLSGPESEAEEPSEPPGEPAEDDAWVEVEKEVIEDDYADVDTSVLSEDEVSPEEETGTAASGDEETESIIGNLALEEKVAQLFIITPESVTGTDIVTRAGDTTKDALTEYPVGGLIYFAQNLEDPDQTKEMLSNTRQYITDACGIEPFLAIDEEGGKVVRIADHEGFDIENTGPVGDIGKKDEDTASDEAYDAGAAIGEYMSDLGFNLDLAPVADDADGIIGDRSFGSDPALVSKLSWQFASGLQDKGVTACFKHFPGHGSVGGDTHTGAVSQDKTLDELYDLELIPFQNAADNEARMIMASHISCPNVTGDDMPTSLSYRMLGEVLRGEMGYQGIIITDSFIMEAVTLRYPDPGEAAVEAIKAGADIVLMPADFHEAYNAVLSAASSGDIDESRIDESLRRILKVKLGR